MGFPVNSSPRAGISAASQTCSGISCPLSVENSMTLASAGVFAPYSQSFTDPVKKTAKCRNARHLSKHVSTRSRNPPAMVCCTPRNLHLLNHFE